MFSRELGTSVRDNLFCCRGDTDLVRVGRMPFSESRLPLNLPSGGRHPGHTCAAVCGPGGDVRELKSFVGLTVYRVIHQICMSCPYLPLTFNLGAFSCNPRSLGTWGDHCAGLSGSLAAAFETCVQRPGFRGGIAAAGDWRWCFPSVITLRR